jgi:hypothetical protein
VIFTVFIKWFYLCDLLIEIKHNVPDFYPAVNIGVLLTEPFTDKIYRTVLIKPHVDLFGEIGNGKAIRIIAFFVDFVRGVVEMVK